MRIVDFSQFWPIFAQKYFGFSVGKIFNFVGINMKLSGICYDYFGAKKNKLLALLHLSV